MKLFQSNECVDWRAALDEYATTLRAQHVNRLEELDAWICSELPALITARPHPYITRAELERATVWKMKRGVWRERNRLLVIGNDAALVKSTSKQAFAAVPDPRQPVAILTALAGVGPATASAVLAAYRPEVYPFFDEVVAAQIPALGKVAFTAAYYQRYAARLRARAEELNQTCAEKFSAHDLAQALWTNSGGKVAHKNR